MSRDDEGVAVHAGDGFYTEISADGNILTADVPVDVGGTVQGPTPHNYFLVALGTCTAMTLRLYANRKGWPLDPAKVQLKRGKIYADDCANYDIEFRKIDCVDREIKRARSTVP